MITGCTKVSMMKLIEFNEVYGVDGVSEEDKHALVDTFKKSMERQDQLPLLFQTITVANQALRSSPHPRTPCRSGRCATSSSRRACCAQVDRCHPATAGVVATAAAPGQLGELLPRLS
eukprot:COSAG01_NODE_37514_length_502_cov_2.411911_1_plen_118_part_00